MSNIPAHAGHMKMSAGITLGTSPAHRTDRRQTDTTASIREDQGKIFSENMEILERQQKTLPTHLERALLKLNIGAGGVQSGRHPERMIEAEREAMTVRS